MRRDVSLRVNSNRGFIGWMKLSERPLASEIAEALVRGYPLALKEFSEFGQLLANKLDAQGAESHEQHSEMLGILRRLDREGEDSDLPRMLLAGSLEPVAQVENARRADELAADERFTDAAAVFLEIAEAFDAAGTGDPRRELPHAGRGDVRAGGKYAGRGPAARRVARARIARRAQESWFTTRELERLLGQTPFVRAMEAWANWPELGYATDWLRQAIAEEDDAERRLRFQAALAEVESLTGDPDVVLAETDDVQGNLEPGPRLSIELDRIAALELRGPEEADAAWVRVEEWAETLAAPASRGRCWSRRGMQLAERGDLDGARNAYRRSMAAWADEAGSQEQVAEAFFSMQAAELLLEPWSRMDLDLRPVAASLRGARGTPAAIARRLQNSAAAARIRAHFRTLTGTTGWLSPSTAPTAAFRGSWR